MTTAVPATALESLAAFGPVAWYVFVMTATPGPNNAMLAASGMNFGFRRSLPHIAGIVGGWLTLLAGCALGLGVAFQSLPFAEKALAVAGSLYLAYLAWRIANAAAPTSAEGAKPLSFLEAFGFQFMNPKGWVLALTAATLGVKLGRHDAWTDRREAVAAAYDAAFADLDLDAALAFLVVKVANDHNARQQYADHEVKCIAVHDFILSCAIRITRMVSLDEISANALLRKRHCKNFIIASCI